jgi:hypothetical protein
VRPGRDGRKCSKLCAEGFAEVVFVSKDDCIALFCSNLPAPPNGRLGARRHSLWSGQHGIQSMTVNPMLGSDRLGLLGWRSSPIAILRLAKRSQPTIARATLTMEIANASARRANASVNG